MLAPALASLRQFEPAYLLQERYLYAPSIGVCLAIALGIEWLAERDWFGSRGRAVATTMAAVLMLVWGAVLVKQNRVWDDTVTVYRNSVAVSPRAPLAHVLLSRSYYDAGKPVFRGVFEDNDPGKRLMMIVNFNTDISEFWEFSDTGLKPIDESNEAYKLGVNYVVYGMLH